MFVHQDDSEFDTLIYSHDGGGAWDNERLANRVAKEIIRGGYEVQVSLIDEPTAAIQPIGVWMRRVDRDAWKNYQRLILASQIRSRIVRVCKAMHDLSEHAERLATWAFDDVMVEQPAQDDYWMLTYRDRLDRIDYVTCRKWLKHVEVLQAG